MSTRISLALPIVLGCACPGPDDAPSGQGSSVSGSTDPGGTEPQDPAPPDPTTGTHPTTGALPSASSTGDGDGTTGTDTASGVCGDAVLDPGETCDHGAENGAHAECTPLCRFNVCGDGFVLAGVEGCDDGPGNVDTGYCRSDCQLGVCGDGFVFAQLEACDAGAANGPTYGGCDVDCTINGCGDGQLDVGFEECDLGADNGSGRGSEPGVTGCDLECGLDGRRIFLSSQVFTGDMGTRAGADLACQNMATKAGYRYPKRFRALLADAMGGPEDDVEEDPGGRPFILPSGLIVASSYAALIDQGPGDGIVTTETGEVLLDRMVWTNLNVFGAAYLADPDHTCADWTSASKIRSARVGYSGYAPGDPALAKWQDDRQWLSFAARPCKAELHIYCIEAKAG